MALIVFVSLVLTMLTHASSFVPCPKCGASEVPFPLSTDPNCGNPQYRIHCNKNSPLEFISADGFHYKILSIDAHSRKLIISPPKIQVNACYSSDVSLGGLRLDESLPFNISGRNTVMLFNCSDNILASPLNCTSSSICRLFEDSEEGRGCKGTLCCHYKKDASMTAHRIRLRIGGCSAYTSVVDLKPGDGIRSWNYGVELQWLPLESEQ